jgi:hypothetical protein
LLGLHTGGYGGPGDGDEMAGSTHDSSASQAASDAFNDYWGKENEKELSREKAKERAKEGLALVNAVNTFFGGFKEGDDVKGLADQILGWAEESCTNTYISDLEKAENPVDKERAKEKHDDCQFKQ